ncbi:MAG: LysE family translocator [Rhodobacteraceae bacterium]|nr:LysE family translocator [Paracoccaceae bacterium]
MNIDNWLAFVLAYTIISIIPGPSVMVVVGQALSFGRKAAFICILGDLLGGAVLIALALVGVGAVLAVSALAFAIMKWLGVIYMAYLGIMQIKNAGRITAPRISASFRTGFLTGVLNPKAVVFYVAFLAQFLDPAQSLLKQFTILLPTAAVVVGVVLGGYALLAAQARKTLQSQRAKQRVGMAGGGFLLGGSVVLAVRG